MTIEWKEIQEQAARPGRCFTVKELEDECECGHCGYPLYTGDDALLAGDEAACSHTCAEAIEDRQRRREETLARMCSARTEVEATGGVL